MTLHEAIVQVLKENGRPMTSREIADMVNDGKLYVRKDGQPVPTSQINARVNNYFRIFDRVNGKVVLVDAAGDETKK